MPFIPLFPSLRTPSLPYYFSLFSTPSPIQYTYPIPFFTLASSPSFLFLPLSPYAGPTLLSSLPFLSFLSSISLAHLVSLPGFANAYVISFPFSSPSYLLFPRCLSFLRFPQSNFTYSLSCLCSPLLPSYFIVSFFFLASFHATSSPSYLSLVFLSSSFLISFIHNVF